MPMSWESYCAAQEMPEECPVCGGQYCDEKTGELLVPAKQVPFCTKKCRKRHLAEQKVEVDALAVAMKEAASYKKGAWRD
jgi:hypothetical protein